MLCSYCEDTGRRLEYAAPLGRWLPSDDPCDWCDVPAVDDGPDCIQCGFPACVYSVRTGDTLCVACGRDEQRELQWERLARVDVDEWIYGGRD